MQSTNRFYMGYQKPGYKETHVRNKTTTSLKPGDTGSPIGGLTFLPVGMTAAQFYAAGGVGAVIDSNGNLTVQSVGNATPGTALPAGTVGEIISNRLSSTNATSLTTATAKSLASIVLTPGVWEIQGVVDYVPAASTTIQDMLVGISTTNNAMDAAQDNAAQYPFAVIAGAVMAPILNSPTRYLIVPPGTTTQVYLIAQATFAVSTMTAYGSITAARTQ